MINSIVTIGGHLIERILCDSTGNAMTLPPLYPSMYQFRLKLYNNDDNGNLVPVYPNVVGMTASLGLVYAEPIAGTFKLQYNTDPDPIQQTDEIDFKENPSDFKAKLLALAGSSTYGLTEVYQSTPSTWMLKFSCPDPLFPPPIDISGVENELQPETFVRIRQFSQNGDWWVEVRLMQGPIASTSAHDTVLANAPEVTRIRAGYTEVTEFDEIHVNEIQAIYVPPIFTGTYMLKFDGRLTSILSANSGAAAIAAALNVLYTDNRTRFTVTNPEINKAYVEFVGVLSGRPQDLLIVVVGSYGNPELIFNLNLDTTETAQALQNTAEADVIFEVKLFITDPAVPGDPGQNLILFQADAIVRRPLHWEGLEESAPIDWLFPPNPKDYIPFDINSVVTGSQSYATTLGDGTATSFSISHHLGQAAISIAVRQNFASGVNKLLRDNEYVVTLDNEDSFTLDVSPLVPGVGELVVFVFAAGNAMAFQAHHHSIDEIDTLQAVLDGILSRIAALEALITTGGGGGGGGGGSTFGTDPTQDLVSWGIPDIWKVVPTNRPPVGKQFDATALPSQGFLLPAVHDAIFLGTFTADDTADTITLDAAPATPLINGQRIRFDQPIFTLIGECTFSPEAIPPDPTNCITCAGHGLISGRQVKFSGGILPASVSAFLVYYVINPTADTFQIATVPDGPEYPLLDPGDVAPHYVSVGSEVPGGLEHSVDYYVSTPTTTIATFQLKILPDPAGTYDPTGVIDITSAGYSPNTATTIDDAPMVSPGILPDPTGYPDGIAFSIREDVRLLGARGLRAETVHAGDVVASDGIRWYHVTRSDAPGSNSFYPNNMEQELFRIAINDKQFPPGSIFTLTFELTMQMYKNITNIQYLIVVEWADLTVTTFPAPTGPNLYQVLWNRKPIMQQRLIATEIPVIHTFGAQILHRLDGSLRTNKKIYGVESVGDSIPPFPNLALRCRLVEFDTEDNIKNAMGLVAYQMSKANAQITLDVPAPPPVP